MVAVPLYVNACVVTVACYKENFKFAHKIKKKKQNYLYLVSDLFMEQ